MANRRPPLRTSGPKHAKQEIAGADSPTVELLAYNAVHVGRNGQRQAYHAFFGPQRGGINYGHEMPDGNFGPVPSRHNNPKTLKEANLSARENGNRRLNRLYNGVLAYVDHMEDTGRSPNTSIERRTTTRQKFMKRVISGESHVHGLEAIGQGWMLHQEGQEDNTPLHLSKQSKLADGTIHAKAGNWVVVVDQEGIMHYGDYLKPNGEGRQATFQALGTIDLDRYDDDTAWRASGDNFSPGMIGLYNYEGKRTGDMDLTHLEGMVYAAGEAAGMMSDEDQLRTQPIPTVH